MNQISNITDESIQRHILLFERGEAVMIFVNYRPLKCGKCVSSTTVIISMA